LPDILYADILRNTFKKLGVKIKTSTDLEANVLRVANYLIHCEEEQVNLEQMRAFCNSLSGQFSSFSYRDSGRSFLAA